jgi:hypothetical protein
VRQNNSADGQLHLEHQVRQNLFRALFERQADLGSPLRGTD